MSLQSTVRQGNLTIHFDQAITKGWWFQPIGCHIWWSTDSLNATRLGLCNGLLNSGDRVWDEVIKCILNWITYSQSHLTLLMLEMEYSSFGCQYHACWCPGDLSHQGISRNGIDCIGLATCKVAPCESGLLLLNKIQDMTPNVNIYFIILKTIQHVTSFNRMKPGLHVQHLGKVHSNFLNEDVCILIETSLTFVQGV